MHIYKCVISAQSKNLDLLIKKKKRKKVKKPETKTKCGFTEAL